ncbi:MAG: cytochrome c oxidase accessory protein CcoG [Candidatus Binatia bacterium]
MNVAEAAGSGRRASAPLPGAGMRSPGAPTKEVPLYEARTAIYQREVRGPWQDFRAVFLFLLAGFYIGLPWLTWEGRQAVWFDVPGRKFYLLGLTFWPQDFIFLSGLLILGALSLFFFTNLAGRLWCGYACPQTVWTKFFMWMEWLTEGDRNQRILLDRQPWSRRKVLKKVAKHSSWLAFSAVVGVTFVGYFLPIRELLPRIATGSVTGGETVFLALASLLLYADAGFMREQICKYACPYARFQGAMFDRATLTIFYDKARGEPRGHRRRGAEPAELQLGHCVDCKLCVHVCPTGIDIRNGTQYECIGCAACIDACDSVMEEVGYPKGLVRYSSESALAGKPLPLLRPRVVGYGLVLVGVATALFTGLALRLPLEVDVIRDRARLYREVADDQIENVYTVKVMNKGQHERAYRLSMPTAGFTMIAPEFVTVAPGKLEDVAVRVRADRDKLAAASTSLAFVVTDAEDPAVTVTEDSRFLAPASVARDGQDDDEAED